MKSWKKLLCLGTALFLLFASACTNTQVQTSSDWSSPSLSDGEATPASSSAPPLEETPEEETSSLPPTYVEPDGAISIEEFTQEGLSADTLDEDGVYTSKEDVSLYLHLYGHLPDNYITKQEAQELGWEGGSLEPYAPGKCIGGSYFGNYEGLLPEDHDYRECDIDTLGADRRGAKRLIYSDDGLIYYTEDHYESFTLLYGEE